MRFTSTRSVHGDSSDAVGEYSFAEAVLVGWATDGGMILPQTLPKITAQDLDTWRHLSYTQLAATILDLFAGSAISAEDICSKAFQPFGGKPGQVVALTPLTNTSSSVNVRKGEEQPSRDANVELYLLELWHGPTLAFKDLGMQILCQTLQALLASGEGGGRRTVLVGTSGDTGPSALFACDSCPLLDCVVLYPKGRISKVQEGQMVRWRHAKRAKVIACEGTSDDLDVPCLQVFEDEEFRELHKLGSVNSVNVLRLLAQIIHYFWAYLQLTHKTTEDNTLISFSVPTGAAGHVTAGLIAKLMGLPIHTLIMAVNSNDVLHKMLSTGVLHKGDSVHYTSSPAMDIQAPYNVERMLYLVTRDGESVSRWMKAFNAGDKVLIPPSVIKSLRDLGLVSYSISEDVASTTMKKIHEQDNVIIDPHTAVGVSAALQYTHTYNESNTNACESIHTDGDHRGKRHVIVCMGCSHPAKFSEIVSKCLNIDEKKMDEIMPDKEHKCVSAVLRDSGSWLVDTHIESNTCERSDICIDKYIDGIQQFRKGDDWLGMLKIVLEEVSESRAGTA